MRARLLASLFVILAPLTVATSARSGAPLAAAAVDARVMLPGGINPGGHYVRVYVLRTIRSEADLPFSSEPAFRFRKPREVWAAVFILTPSVFSTDSPGVRVIGDVRTFPRVVHGGCLAVNVVADARTGATLGSWCNGAGRPGPRRPIPTYIPRGSPIKVR